MSAQTWLRKLLGPTLSVDGAQVTPDTAAWNVTAGSGLRVAIAHNTSTGRTDIQIDRGDLEVLSPALIGAHQNNYSPAGWSTADIVRLVASSTYNITGLDATADRSVKMLMNVGINALTLKHASANSDPANRFDLSSGADYVLNPGACALVVYDTVSLRWRKVG